MIDLVAAILIIGPTAFVVGYIAAKYKEALAENKFLAAVLIWVVFVAVAVVANGGTP